MPALLLILIPFLHTADARACGRFPSSDFRKAGQPAFRRAYTNYGFGYRVRLPRNVTAYGEPPPQPAHGVGIILSWEPRSYLYLAGFGNVNFLANTAAAADDEEAQVRRESAAVLSVTHTAERRGRYNTQRLRIVHRCGSETFVTDALLLLRRDIVYTISLTSPQSRYQTDRRVLNAIARSFRLIRIR